MISFSCKTGALSMELKVWTKEGRKQAGPWSLRKNELTGQGGHRHSSDIQKKNSMQLHKEDFLFFFFRHVAMRWGRGSSFTPASLGLFVCEWLERRGSDDCRVTRRRTRVTPNTCTHGSHSFSTSSTPQTRVPNSSAQVSASYHAIRNDTQV